MKLIISILISITLFVVNCNKDDGNQEIADPIKPKDEYTKENPAEWAEVANAHVPHVELKGKLGNDNIKVSVLGTDFNEEHYIEKVGVVDKEKKELISKSLKKGETETLLTLKYDPELLAETKVFVKCNLHDVWTLTLDKASVKQ